MSLPQDVRPMDFGQVIGQDLAVQVLFRKLAEKTFPHVVMLTGPTGVGKTTLARICARVLTAQPPVEINCADVRGIDSVRMIDAAMAYKNLDGSPRVWILDEVVQLPKATQQCFLSVLENEKPWVYFFLCTSDTTGLLPTFMGRCFQVALQALSMLSVQNILDAASVRANKSIPLRVIGMIARQSDGNARKALQSLEAVLGVEGEESQLAAAGMAQAGQEEQGEFLAKALFRRASWAELVPIIQKLGTNPSDLETIRRQVLAYACKTALNPRGHQVAAAMIKLFREPWQWCGQAGLIDACWDLCKPR